MSDMSTMEGDKVMLILLKEENSFDKLIKEKLSGDKIVLILRIVKNICETVFTENTGLVLSMLCEHDFIDQLTNYIKEIIYQENDDKKRNGLLWSDVNQFWDNLAIFFENLLKLKPNEACTILPKILKATIRVIKTFDECHEDEIYEDIQQKFEDLQTNLSLTINEREKKKVVQQNTVAEVLEPPDNFR